MPRISAPTVSVTSLPTARDMFIALRETYRFVPPEKVRESVIELRGHKRDFDNGEIHFPTFNALVEDVMDVLRGINTAAQAGFGYIYKPTHDRPYYDAD